MLYGHYCPNIKPWTSPSFLVHPSISCSVRPLTTWGAGVLYLPLPFCFITWYLETWAFKAESLAGKMDLPLISKCLSFWVWLTPVSLVHQDHGQPDVWRALLPPSPMVSFQSLAASTVSSIQLEVSSSNCLALPFQGSRQRVSSGLLYTTPDFHPFSASILCHPRAPRVNQPFQPPLGRLFCWSQHQSSPSTEPKANHCEPFLKYHQTQDDWFWVPISM